MVTRCGRTARSNGFSLVEMLVVVVIIFFALAVSIRLIVLSQKRAVVEQRRILDPAVSLALNQLKTDVRGALDGSAALGEGGPLVLAQPSGVTITYELEDEDLWRSIDDPPGRRLFLSAVKKFEWAWLADVPREKPILQVDVEYETTLMSGAMAVDDHTRDRIPRGLESRSLRLTLRGDGGVGW